MVDDILYIRSENIKDAILHNVTDPWPRSKLCRNTLSHGGSSVCATHDDYDISYLYPLLQPLATSTSNASTTKDMSSPDHGTATAKRVIKYGGLTYVNWNEADAKLKISLHGDNPMGSFIDTTWGSFMVSLKDLVETDIGLPNGVQNEVCRWYNITWNQGHLNVSKLYGIFWSFIYICFFIDISVLWLCHHFK